MPKTPNVSMQTLNPHEFLTQKSELIQTTRDWNDPSHETNYTRCLTWKAHVNKLQPVAEKKKKGAPARQTSLDGMCLLQVKTVSQLREKTQKKVSRSRKQNSYYNKVMIYGNPKERCEIFSGLRMTLGHGGPQWYSWCFESTVSYVFPGFSFDPLVT